MTYWEKYTDMIKDIPGDIVECGVGRGQSLITIAKLNPDRIIYGYDSFEGFPEPTKEDKSPRNPKKGEWSKSLDGKQDYTKDYVYSVLDREGINNVILTKGFFDESTKNHPDRPITLLHLDSDLYQSHKVPLEILFDKVISGGIVVFDDIHEDYFPGGMIAVKEFFNGKDGIWGRNNGKYYYIKP